jgi:hypothetical protein
MRYQCDFKDCEVDERELWFCYLYPDKAFCRKHLPENDIPIQNCYARKIDDDKDNKESCEKKIK